MNTFAEMADVNRTVNAIKKDILKMSTPMILMLHSLIGAELERRTFIKKDILNMSMPMILMLHSLIGAELERRTWAEINRGPQPGGPLKD